MKVCIGGTFDIIHEGHKKLINKAFETAKEDGFVFIGLTTIKVTMGKKFVKPIEERKKNLQNYLSEKWFKNRYLIKPINDKYGPSINGDFDAIIVSPETYETAAKINLIRVENKKKPLKIIKIPFVLAKDGKPISSTRIYKGEIDKNGNTLEDD